VASFFNQRIKFLNHYLCVFEMAKKDRNYLLVKKILSIPVIIDCAFEIHFGIFLMIYNYP